MTTATQTISIPVDLTNPGQFFACCGLLELAHRLWPTATSLFRDNDFQLLGGGSLVQLLEVLASKPPVQLDGQDDMTSPLFLQPPFKLRLGWWKDDSAGDTTFKTWAGQQKIVRIARAMHAAFRASSIAPELLLNTPAVLYDPVERSKTVEPFYFDSRRAAQAKSIDVGFSADAHDMMMPVYAAVEFLCLVGLQRFRPQRRNDDRFRYSTWPFPLLPQAASAVACGAVSIPGSCSFAFPLLYRTKYLKGFLPATMIGDDQ